MWVVTASEVKNQLGDLFDSLERNPGASVLIERNRRPVAMMLNAEVAECAILGAYGQGVLPRALVMQQLGLNWYGDLLQRLDALGVPAPRLSDAALAPMTQAATDILAAAAASSAASQTAIAEESLTMNVPVKLVIPDASPLIILAHADALDLLLRFDASQVQLVVTDLVEFEVTRDRATRPDAQRIADFLALHAGRIVIEPTHFGQMAIASALTHERYEQSEQVRQFYEANGMPAPRPLAPNGGELSITSYVAGLIDRPPGPPCLIVAEDEFFLRSNPGALPGNAHIISTTALLAQIERIDPSVRASDVLRAAVEFRGRLPNRHLVDRPALKIPGSSWTGLLKPASIERGIGPTAPR